MEAMLAYLLKVSVSAIFFYLFIRILMERETQHEYIRGLWIGAIVFSLVLPFIYVPVPDLFSEKVEAAESMNIVMSGGEPEMLRPEETAAAVDWLAVLGYVYIAGAAIVSIVYAASFIRLYVRIRRTPRTHEYDSVLRRCAEESGCSREVRLYVTDDSSTGPYSWMRSIVINRKDMENDGRDIILHEMGHISHGHSWDVILTELFTCLLWFNPASWLIQYSLRQIHEYSADRTVLRSGADAREYQTLLIRKAAGSAYHSIANSFNHSNLKNRITMMLQNQTSKSAYAKSLALFPVLVCLLFVFSASRPAPSDKVNEIPAETEISSQLQTSVQASGDAIPLVQSPAPAVQEDDDPVPFQFVDVKPSFMGGDANDFSRWVCEHLVYPEEAKSAKIQGRVTLKFTVNTDGSVSDVKILRGVNKLLDAEAVRVVSMSTDWAPGMIDGKPVRVSYTFPVIFKLSGNGDDDAEKVPDIYIDGKKATSEDLQKNKLVDGYVDENGEIHLMSTRLSDRKDFIKWANTVLVYSQEAKSAGKYGTVRAAFKIKSDGTVGDIVIKESPDEIFSQEVRRVVASSPEWSKSAYQHIMVDGPGCVELSVGFCLKSVDKDGNIVWLGSEVEDHDIAVMAFADNALEARAMKK